MNRREFLQNASLVVASAKLGQLHAQTSGVVAPQGWRSAFLHPPDATYPWAYSFWLNGNVTKQGITTDLEGMKEVGIRGLIFMDGAVGNPPGPVRFMSESWLDTFHHMLAEAGRLGIEVNLNNDPGWAGSGGPWITPEQATQVVVVSHTVAKGPSHFEAPLARPANIRRGYYEDIAVLAYPLPADGAVPSYRIPDFNSTKSFAGGHDFDKVVPWPRFIPTDPEWPEPPAAQILPSAGIQDLTGKLDAAGKLTWEVPTGHWIIFRFGHTVANGATRSVQKEAAGLEIDKLSKSSVSAHFDAMVGKLSALAGPLAGKTLVSTHIDSWEAGSGNWTTGFRDEFRHRRGYDLLSYLPALGGMVVDSREVSERFLWDYRETVCELLLENYAGHFRELAHSKGLRLTIEAYDGTCDDLRYAGRADEPMSEFWRSCYNGLPLSDLNESMTSAAHVYGKQIIGAEAFTAARGDFLNHPATLKPLADWAFCIGVNRLCFSEWIMQPWQNPIPGVSFAIFGTVFHQTLTWWAQAKPWHEYIARCQYMLRQGHFIADVCFVAPEGAPYRFTPPIPATQRGVIPQRPSYNFDGCPPELVLNEMTVRDGKIVLSSGMQYSLLVLPSYDADGQDVIRLMEQDDYFYKPMPMPNVQTMTPQLLRKIKSLIEDGATVLGKRPVKSPSLADFPACDEQITQLADEIWGKNAGSKGEGEHRLGEGRVVWGFAPEEVLTRMGIAEDFRGGEDVPGKFNYTHRRAADGSDIYFVVNQQPAFLQRTCRFRVTGKQPELFWPQSGSIEPMAAFEQSDGVTAIPLSLHANESVFVVFRQTGDSPERIASVTCDGEQVWPKAETPSQSVGMDDSFTMALWVRPGPDLTLPEEIDGGWAYTQKDVPVPGLGSQTSSGPGQGRFGFTIGRNGIVVYQYGDSGAIEPILVYRSPITESVQVGVIYTDRIPKLFLNGKLVKTGPKNRFPKLGGGSWADKRTFAGETASVTEFDNLLKSAGLEDPVRFSAATDALAAVDLSHRRIRKPGEYEFKTANGRVRRSRITLPGPQEIPGPWQVEFDPKWGGPAKITFEELQDWSTHPDKGIRYYSGHATYRKTFHYARSIGGDASRKVDLDLGNVAVIAEVTLNGQNLGVAWNSPYRLDATPALKEGENLLEVKIANVWVNRLIGDEQLPPDSERGPNGGVTAWPPWVLEGKPSPTGRFTFTSRRQWEKDDPLVESGLLGPVRLLTSQSI